MKLPFRRRGRDGDVTQPGLAHRHMDWRDLSSESLAGIAARPARLVLSTLGTVLGIGALVATVGLSQTASGQVASRFDRIAATHVVIEPRSSEELVDRDADPTVHVIPWDAPERVAQLNGMVSAGTFTRVDVGEARVRSVPVIDPRVSDEQTMPVVAASPELLDSLQGRVVTGRFFDQGHEDRRDLVAVLGVNAAAKLHVSRIDDQPTIFLGSQPFTVVGIVDDVARRVELLDSVIIPNSVGQRLYALDHPAELHIRTRLGAASLVGHQAPIALDPNRPEAFRATVPPSAEELRSDVQADINGLFLALGSVALLVAAVGIANITLRSVLERIGEIGLRRALGATPRQVAAQFVIESVAMGLLGGIVGTAVGILATVGVAVVREWTPLLPGGLPLLGPALGGVVGLLAGAYPAWRAAAIEPIAALRSGGR